MIHNNYIVYTLHDAGNGTCGLYTKWTICRLRLVHNDYMTWGLHPKIYDFHVTGVITWRLYHLHNFKLRAWYNTLPNRDCEHGVLHSQNYRHDFVFLHHSFMYGFRFFAFLLTLHFGFLCNYVSICVHISLALMGFTICSHLQIATVSTSWTGTHMPVVVKTCSFITATLVSKYFLLCSRRCHHFSILCN